MIKETFARTRNPSFRNGYLHPEAFHGFPRTAPPCATAEPRGRPLWIRSRRHAFRVPVVIVVVAASLL